MPKQILGMTLSIIVSLTLGVSSNSHSADNKTLFAKMGGEPALRAAVQELSELVLVDERISFTFANADMDVFRSRLYNQLCALAEGPCEYNGRSMRDAHKDLAIDNAQFNALAEALYTAMERADIAYRFQNQLMAKLAPMQRTIVTE